MQIKTQICEFSSWRNIALIINFWSLGSAGYLWKDKSELVEYYVSYRRNDRELFSTLRG